MRLMMSTFFKLMKSCRSCVLHIALSFCICFTAFAESDEPVYIDVRTWLEHKVDHIDGDQRIHVSDIVAGVTDAYPDKETPIALYCRSGIRSETAMEKLKAAGYLNVSNLGGIDDAREARLSE